MARTTMTHPLMTIGYRGHYLHNTWVDGKELWRVQPPEGPCWPNLYTRIETARLAIRGCH